MYRMTLLISRVAYRVAIFFATLLGLAASESRAGCSVG
jgi:hypothetical protein